MAHLRREPQPKQRTLQRRRTKTVVSLLTGSAVAAVLLTPVTVQAQRRGEPQLQVSYVTDGALSCEQLTAEIATVVGIAGIAAQNAQNAANQGTMANVATSVAINGALYSGALGAVPGLGMFASMAGGMARRNAEARARAEAENIRIAEQRHSLLTGIYQGRQCGAPPPPEPVVAVQSTPAAVETGVPVAQAEPAILGDATASPAKQDE